MKSLVSSFVLGALLAGGPLLGGCGDGTIFDPDPEEGLSGEGATPPGGEGNQTPPPGMVNVPPERKPMPAPGVNPPGAAIRCNNEVIAPRVLRRLTNGELENTIRAAFGLDQAAWPTPSLIPDPASSDGFTNNVDRLSVGENYAQRLLETGRDVADRVVEPTVLGRLLPCSATLQDSCAGTYLDTVGQKLFRRPLTTVERERYLALLPKVKAGGGDLKEWVRYATLAMLSSPNTIYRSELGEAMGGGKYKLNPYEVASALSYAYTGGPPPPELLQLAQANRLGTAADVEAGARLLMYSAPGVLRPAFQAQLVRFTDQWLGLSPLSNLAKDKVLFPDYSQEVQDALGEEVRRFVTGVLVEGKGKPSDLMTAPFTYVNQTLSHFYGMAPVAGEAFQKVNRPANTGIGLVAQGAVLAIAADSKSTSPTKRGHLVRERLLCNIVPPPPAVVDPVPEPTDAQTTRQRYEMLHARAAECKTCHLLMDPIGFGLEHLDATGRFRAREGRFDIDDSGFIANTSAGDVTFTGADALARELGKLPEVADCMADFSAAYAFGINHVAAGCISQSGTEDLRTGKISFLDYMLRLSRAESFRVRVE